MRDRSKNQRARLRLALAPVLAIGLLAGCTSSGSSTSNASAGGAPRSGGTLNVGIQSDFVTLNPTKSSALVDRQAFINIFDPLLKLSPTLQVEPNLITSWTITNGGKTYTFALRKGVTFQDGTPFDASAIIYNWRWEMNRANASPRRSNLTLVSGLSAPNPNELVVELKAPFSPFLQVLTGRVGMISSPAAMQRYGAQYGLHPVGTGPFEFQSWVKGAHLTLVRNPHYWRAGLPYLSKVVYTPITNPVQEYDALVTGQVSLIDTVPNQDLSKLSSASGIQSSVKPSLGYTDIVLNTTVAPFNNVHNREAVSYAIDRVALNRLIYFGYGTPAYTQFPPLSFAYSKNVTVPSSDTLARAQLVKAGNPNGFSFNLEGGNDPVSAEQMQAIQSELGKVGIRARITPLDNTTLLTDAVKGRLQGSLLFWSGRPDPDQNSYAFDVTGGSLNWSGYSNPAVDSLLKKAREASTTPARRTFYVEASKILLHDAPYVFLAYPPNAKAWANSVHGYVNYPDGLMRLTKVSVG